MVLLGSDDKSFEVLLHAGTAAALLAGGERPRVSPLAALTLAPAALAGLFLERPIEERLGRRAVGVGQVLGGSALLIANRSRGRRGEGSAGPRDALLIGLAQACALVPGVSRNGSTLTAARLLGFRRGAAARMSREAALPVILGATALRLARLRAAPPANHLAGFAAALGSSLASLRLVPEMRSYRGIALYRIALGAAILASARRAAPISRAGDGSPGPLPADGLEWEA